MSTLLYKFQTYFQRWAAQRSPRSTQIVLRHRTIYVFPSKQGVALLLLVLLIWVLGTNYQNNIILGLAFFLLSLMLVSIIHAFKNLLGLTFSPETIQNAIVGEMAPFNIRIGSSYLTNHYGLLLTMDKTESVATDVIAGHAQIVNVGVTASHRGWLTLPRILLKSYFPFGLIRAWAYIDLDHRVLIFPQPIETALPPLGIGQGADGIYLSHQLGDEFQGFQTYQLGAPLARIAWKHYARGAGMYLKDYRALQSEHYWLDWDALSSHDIELRLSHLSYWVNEFSSKNIEFGLRLPRFTLELGVGDSHRLQALTALALFGCEDKRSGS